MPAWTKDIVLAGGAAECCAAGNCSDRRGEAGELFSRGPLRPMAKPTAEGEGHRTLVRRRKRIAESQDKSKHKIKGVLKASGIEDLPACKSGRERRPTICQPCRSPRNILWRWPR